MYFSKLNFALHERDIPKVKEWTLAIQNTSRKENSDFFIPAISSLFDQLKLRPNWWLNWTIYIIFDVNHGKT